MGLYLPTEDEIKSSITELFDKVYQKKNRWLLSALVPIDTKLTDAGKVITYVVDDEVRELCDFLNGFDEMTNKTENDFQKKRIKILNYCHILEADFPLTVIWNLLRILNGQESLWTFYVCNENGVPIENKRKTYNVLRFSLEKINAIIKLSTPIGLKIGVILKTIWQSDLRNAFSHSQYFWIGSTFRVSNTISPLSRKDEDIEKTIIYTNEEIENLYKCASVYLITFIDMYKKSISPYKDGKPYPIHAGIIKWTKYNWKWAD